MLLTKREINYDSGVNIIHEVKYPRMSKNTNINPNLNLDILIDFN